MITGKFFIPEFSEEDDHRADTFRYKLLQCSGSAYTLQEKYPIYLTLKEKSVEFNFQGKVTSRDEENGSHIFGQSTLLKISVGDNQELTNESIKSIFLRELGFKWFMETADTKLFLGKSLQQGLVIPNDSDLTERDPIFYSIIEPDPNIKQLSFSSLECFGLDTIFWETTVIDDEGGPTQNKYVSLTPEIKKTFLRRLLLDFLEDFFLSNTFRYSSNYTLINDRIRGNNLLSGIFLKADFYVKNKKIRRNIPPINTIPSLISYLQPAQTIGEDPDPLSVHQFVAALDKWSHFIVSETNKDLFAVKKHYPDVTKIWVSKSIPEAWFNYADVELTNALIKRTDFKLYRSHNGANSDQKKSIYKRSANYLTSNYEIVKSIFVTFSVSKYPDVPLLLAILLSFALSLFFYSFYRNPLGSNPITLRSLGFIASLIGSIPVAYWLLGKLHIKSYFLRNSKSSKRIQTIRIISAVINAAIFCSFFLYWAWWLFNGGLDNLLLSDWKWLIFALSTFIVFGIICALISITIIGHAINIILPRLQMAIITAWIAILSPFDFWKIGFNVTVPNALIYGGLLVIFTATYLLFQIIRNTSLKDKPKTIWRLVNVMVPGYFLSLSVGFIGINLMAPSYMTQNDFFFTKNVRDNIFEINELDFQKQQLQKYRDSIATQNEGLGMEAIIARISQSKEVRKITDSLKLKLTKNLFLIDSIETNLRSLESSLRIDSLFRHAHDFNIVTSDINLAYLDSLKKITKLSSDSTKMMSKQNFLYKFQLAKKIKVPTPSFVHQFLPAWLTGPWNLKHTIIIIPGFLILMSAFALFSGIFLTLVFDDKPVTDPL